MKYFGPAIVLAAFATFGLAQDEPKKVTRAEALSAVVMKVAPEYPNVARQLRIEGSVELEALVTEAGVVAKVKIVSGNPILTAPAVESVKKWKFKPFTTDGKAIPVLAPVTLNFRI